MNQRLTGKTAIVTGAAQGIGRAAAEKFAREGARIVIADVNELQLNEVAESIRREGAEVISLAANIEDENDVQLMVAAAVENFGRLDCAFNNAGICEIPKPLHEFSLDEFMKTQSVNVRGTFNCLRAEISAMLKTGGGSIVNTCSTLGLLGLAGYASYVASKHAIAGLTKTAALDYATLGIRVNAIAPGVCRTPLVENLVNELGTDAQFTDSIPMKRLGEPDEIAEIAVWLASDGAPFVTGTIITADGGTSIT